MLKTIGSAPGVVFLKLTAYAADAMRVLNTLQQQADRCQSFDQTIKAVCVDWRNPGSLDDPADLITEALMQISSAMAQLMSRQVALER